MAGCMVRACGATLQQLLTRGWESTRNTRDFTSTQAGGGGAPLRGWTMLPAMLCCRMNSCKSAVHSGESPSSPPPAAAAADAAAPSSAAPAAAPPPPPAVADSTSAVDSVSGRVVNGTALADGSRRAVLAPTAAQAGAEELLGWRAGPLCGSQRDTCACLRGCIVAARPTRRARQASIAHECSALHRCQPAAVCCAVQSCFS